MFGLNPTLILGSILAFILAMGGAYVAGDLSGHKAANKTWELAVAKQKNEAAQLLAKSEADARSAEQRMNTLKDEVESEHAKSEADINAAYAANQSLVAQLGGLRDKQGRGSSCPSVVPQDPKPSGEPAKPTAGGCQLSAETSRALLDLATLADRTAVYAATCHAWVEALPGSASSP